MSISVNGIRNMVIAQEEGSYDYAVKINTEEDFISIDWSSSSIIDLMNELDRSLPSVDSYDILPILRDFFIELPMAKDEAYQLTEVVMEPNDCIILFDTNDVLNKMKREKSESYDKALWLYENWKKGFRIYRDLD